MKAKDVMTRKVIAVKPGTSVKEIAKVLYKKKISGVPVVDEENNLLGIVSETDLILKASGPHLPAHIQILGGIIYLETPHTMEEELKKVLAFTAGNLMTGDVITVGPEDEVKKLADIMVKENVNRIPVVENKKLVGIVTRHDLLKAMM